jgi:tRNA threonylcarbamoyladenosine biosynthesis protein TsaB
MLVLGIDTTGPTGGVALVEDTQVLASFYLRRPPTFSLHLLRIIDLVCAQVGCQLAAVAGFAVSLGPGAFTGLRVGYATAQGLAMAHGKPLLGCSTFAGLAALAIGWDGMVCPVLEARRGEVYAALYRRRKAVVQEVLPGMVLTPAALCASIEERTLFLGSGVRTYGDVLTATLGERAVCVEPDTDVEAGLAISVARLGYQRLCVLPVHHLPTPTLLYIRAADARLPTRAAGAAGISDSVPPASSGSESERG